MTVVVRLYQSRVVLLRRTRRFAACRRMPALFVVRKRIVGRCGFAPEGALVRAIGLLWLDARFQLVWCTGQALRCERLNVHCEIASTALMYIAALAFLEISITSGWPTHTNRFTTTAFCEPSKKTVYTTFSFVVDEQMLASCPLLSRAGGIAMQPDPRPPHLQIIH